MNKMKRLKSEFHITLTFLFFFLQLLHVGTGFEVCGLYVSYDPKTAICCNETVHVMDYADTCCCEDAVFDASVDICCDGVIRPRVPTDEDNCCKCPDKRLDVAILADNSEGLSASDLATLKEFVKDIINNLDIDNGDVRVSLVVFTHIVFIDFYLGNFSTAAEMLDVINGTGSRSGGTETGLALKEVREQVFQEINGDRPGVPNFVLVVTDGKSNNQTSTMEEADLLKADGVFLLAVGVGDSTDEAELEYITSNSTDYIKVDSFDSLQQFENQINEEFFSCKDFPSNPYCGNYPYDPQSEICCQGNAFPAPGSRSDYGCCGNTGYYKPEELCCNDVVHNVGSNVQDYQCCGLNNIYDTTSELCCYGNPVGVYGDPVDHLCCGSMDAYNVANQLCCNDSVVSVPGPSQDYQCCGNSSAFDDTTQICCLGNPVPIADGCCGDDEVFDPATQICCGGIVQPVYGNNIDGTKCCNGTSYDVRCFECQGDQLVSIINETTHICCQGNPYELIYDNNCCCGDQLFDSTLKVCCNGRTIDRPLWDKSDCCECRGSKLDLAIVIDHSESAEPFHTQIIDFVKAVIWSASVNDQDDRIAFLVYTHNVYTVFDLNDYGTINEMMNAVDTWNYSTGATYTHLALYELNSIFTTANGDRDDAANVVILLADGKSHDTAAAIAEATALKATGVTIFTIGIVGDSDFSELAAIASDPTDKYMYNVTDFDSLAHLHIPVKEYAGDECFDNPVDPPRPQCNGISYMDEYYICCNGNIQPRLGGTRAACCGDVSYDRKFYVCCDGDLSPAEAGSKTECCCRRSYNPDTHICCGNAVRRRMYGEYTECCGNAKYDSRSQVCCYNEVQESFGPGSTDCCFTQSYNTKCYSCDSYYNIVPLFDPSTKVCCDGNIQPIKFGDQSCCCADKQFNMLGKLCCEGRIRDVPASSTCACCGDRLYEVTNQICCNGETRNTLYGNMTICCGGRVMHAGNQLCCNDEIVDKISDDDKECCDGVPYNPDKQLCCKNKVNDLPQDPDVESRCCGRRIYDPATEFCCGGVFSLSSGTACCGKKTRYDPSSQICKDGDVHPANPNYLSRCGDSAYCHKDQICCTGSVQPMDSPGYTKCCYDTSYDVRNATCCLGVLYDSRPETRHQCCLNKAYSSRRRICCDGRLVRKILRSADECCGRRRSFDSRRQVCCDGQVRTRVSGATTQCCGKNSFNPAWYVCCNGDVLLPRKYGDSTACCGDTVYHPLREFCCDGNVIPKDDYDEMKVAVG